WVSVELAMTMPAMAGSASTWSSSSTGAFHSCASDCAAAATGSTMPARWMRGLSAALRAWMRPMRPAPTRAMVCIGGSSEVNGCACAHGLLAGFGQHQRSYAVVIADRWRGAPVQNVAEVLELGAVALAVAGGETGMDRCGAGAGLGQRDCGVDVRI